MNYLELSDITYFNREKSYRMMCDVSLCSVNMRQCTLWSLLNIQYLEQYLIQKYAFDNYILNAPL